MHDYTCIHYKPDWLLQKFHEWTTRESHQETPVCAKHSCQTSFQSDEIWSHNSCTRYASLASNQIPGWIKTLLIVFKGLQGKAPTDIQEMITPSESKRDSIRWNEECALKVLEVKHDTFGKRAFAVYGPLAWNFLPKEINLCDEIEWNGASEVDYFMIQTDLFTRINYLKVGQFNWASDHAHITADIAVDIAKYREVPAEWKKVYKQFQNWDRDSKAKVREILYTDV